MALHLSAPEIIRLGLGLRLRRAARAFFAGWRAARATRIAEQASAAEARKRLLEKRRIGFEALGTNIRNTTGNHGRMKPR